MRTSLLISLLLVSIGVGVAQADDTQALSMAVESITVDELQKHLQFLASDTLQGREAGTVGNHAAGTYLVGELKKTALKPVGDGSDWFQYFHGNMRNIVGILPGHDESLKHEWVLVGGHYDHVGFGAPNNSRGPIGFVHNGADDNASGTAALLEVIEALSNSKLPLRRTVLFAFWDGEEKGLLGSRHFVTNPLRPLEQLKLAVHADMLGRLGAIGIEITGWRTGTGLRQWVTHQNVVGQKIDFNLRYIPESDHWPFYERGVPSLMLHTGKHEDYHRPSDDIERINFKGLRIATELLLRLTIAAANTDSVPTFRATSRRELAEFNALAKNGSITRTPTSPPTRLGVNFDPEAEKQHVIKLVRVHPGGPAERAGLRVRDELLEFDNQPLDQGTEFGTRVLTAPHEVAIKLRRGEQTIALQVLLGGEPVRVGLTLKRDDAEPGSAIVSAVVRESPAHRAKIRIGDRIRMIVKQRTVNTQSKTDGTNTVERQPNRNLSGVESPLAPSAEYEADTRSPLPSLDAELLTTLSTTTDPVELVVERDGRLETITFTPAERFTDTTKTAD